MILIILLGNWVTSYSQQSNLGNWLIHFGNKKIKSNWNWHHEVQYRNYNVIGDLEQLLLRTGFGYNLSERNNNLLLGYAFILGQNYIPGADDKLSISEHRIFQQFLTRHNVNRALLQHRYRFEQRFTETNLRLRLRYFLSLNYPLNNSELTGKTFYLSVYNEIFVNTLESIFDRNRLYGGLGYKLNEKLRLELGYMSQFLTGTSRDQINIIAFTNF